MVSIDLKRFGIAWLVVSSTMFLLSYIWHGVILNDFNRLFIEKNIYLSIMSITYLALGLLVTGLNQLLNSDKASFYKAALIGAGIGFFVYLIAFVFGVSFDKSKQIAHIALDLTWQILEQGFGGFICAVVFNVFTVITRAHSRISMRESV